MDEKLSELEHKKEQCPYLAPYFELRDSIVVLKTLEVNDRIMALEAERETLKEQFGKLMKFTAKVENFDYIWMNHSDIPEMYVMLTKGHYVTCVDNKEKRKSAESRLAEAEKILEMEYFSIIALKHIESIEDYEHVTCAEEYQDIVLKRVRKALRGEAEKK